MPITILPNGHRLIPEIADMPVKGQECPLCGLIFTDMTPIAVFEGHERRCMDRKVDEARQMMAMGYRKTSKGWVKND